MTLHSVDRGLVALRAVQRVIVAPHLPGTL
jgi:hypothetical protein